jgi:hypothetical protein
MLKWRVNTVTHPKERGVFLSLLRLDMWDRGLHRETDEDCQMQTNTAVHADPVWRDRANFLIKARLPPISGENAALSKEWEQLWCKQIAENQFEICCIPYFVYDLALGDVVETGLEGEDRYLIQRVLRPSGRFCFRVWFGGSATSHSRDEVIQFAAQLGCLSEWGSTNLLAIDAGSEGQAHALADYLAQREQVGSLVYETGRNA